MIVTEKRIVSRETVVWAAQQVVRQHEEPPNEDRVTGRCAQCGDDECPLLQWAIILLSIKP